MGLDVRLLIRAEAPVEWFTECVEKANFLIAYHIEADTRFGDSIYNRFIVTEEGAEFETLWRYWGPSYERGPWFLIYGVIQTAIACFPGAVISYGDDCSAYLERVTDELLNSYWEHFRGPHGDAYRGMINNA